MQAIKNLMVLLLNFMVLLILFYILADSYTTVVLLLGLALLGFKVLKTKN
ncbi:hypothetical protein [Romboutsia lituseburensis]|nr:hypothetical protein [Romboutsia lituseburensis]MCR8747031.1 hypothetical protein [Romboutsia lituseburensis]